MRVYNPKEWFHTIIYLHKSTQFKQTIPFIVMIALYSWLVAYLELEYFKMADIAWIKNITIVHSLLGFVLSLLLVFRTNTAYDRWWEARKQWGALTNTSRSLSYKLNAFLANDDKVNRSFFRKSIPLFASTLYNFLRSDYTRFMLDQEEHPELQSLDDQKHGPLQVASMMFNKVNSLYIDGKISGDQLRIINEELTSMMNICGACERIKNTPIPIAYSSFIKTFIIIYSVTLPMGYVFSMGYFVVLAVPFIFYVLLTLEVIGESIEEPFGGDIDDLPIDKIANNIKNHSREVLLP